MNIFLIKWNGFNQHLITKGYDVCFFYYLFYKVLLQNKTEAKKERKTEAMVWKYYQRWK